MQTSITASANAETGLAKNQYNVITFNSADFGNVRTVLINDEPWFVGKDVAKALGYSDTRKSAIMHVDEDDRTRYPIIDTMGRKQDTTVINESGVYALVLGSKLENAKKFKHWITSEVLPSIRRTGGYRVPQTYYEALALAANQAKEIEIQKKEIAVIKPKAEEYDKLAGRDYCRNFRDTAETLGIGQAAFIDWLLVSKYIYKKVLKNGGIEYRSYAQMQKYFKLVPFVSRCGHKGNQLLVTLDGIAFFRAQLKLEREKFLALKGEQENVLFNGGEE